MLFDNLDAYLRHTLNAVLILESVLKLEKRRFFLHYKTFQNLRQDIILNTTSGPKKFIKCVRTLKSYAQQRETTVSSNDSLQ